MLPTMIAIQPLRPEESAAAKSFLQEAWRGIFGLHDDPFVRDYFDDPQTLKDLDDIEAAYFSQGGTILAASENGRIVATGALSRADGGSCELCRMFVHSDYRRRGIAASLCEALLAFARTQGYKRVYLSSNRHLTDSHRLYEGLGFREIPPLIASYAKYAIFMEKAL